MSIDFEKLTARIFADAREDLDATQSILETGRARQAMLFAHLALEKVLKALVMGAIRSAPPKVHDLKKLAELAGLQPDQGTMDFLGIMNYYGIAGRYLEVPGREIRHAQARSDFDKVKELFEWLTNQP